METSIENMVASKTIGRRYQLIELLGEGGMGAAYKALDRLTGRIITLKRGLPLRGSWELPPISDPQGAIETVDPRALPADRSVYDVVSFSTDETVISRMMPVETAPTVLPGGAQLPLPLGDETVMPAPLVYEREPISGLEATVMPPPEVRSDPSVSGDPRTRLALAREFEVLAGLRHPNIISVLDYGFDENNQPYFTMELVENASRIDEAGRGQALEIKVDLLLQILEALVYLHRRGVIHRDLKPSNVLVSGGLVKVLDFGISLKREEGQEPTPSLAGTFGFIAPEVLLGGVASALSDIYALGVIAAKMCFGVTPAGMLEVKLEEIEGDPEVVRRLHRAVLEMVRPAPDERVQSAHEAIAMLSEAIGQPLPPESEDAREGFLQTAAFVGRDGELSQMMELFAQARVGRGGLCLIAGESGVGKSRLLSELRTQALVRGAMVVRGQAVAHGGSAYHLWREVATRLVLTTRLTPLETSVLKSLVPDIERVLNLSERVPEPPMQDPEAAQARLFGVIEDLLRRQEQTLVLILEDLHWAGVESLKMLAAINRSLPWLSVMVVGSYRDEEIGHVHEQLPGAQTFRLGRLTSDDIASLSESILGASGRDEAVQEVLRQQSEGNPFFLVELVRAYAEIAGRLDEVAGVDLTQKLLPEGISALVRRRLDRLGEGERALLRVAAVLGRELDLPVLVKLEPGLDWTAHLTRWLEAAVVSIQDGQWRFAHDKLREQLVVEVDASGQRVEAHRRVAVALEQVYGEDPEIINALVYHWRQAGDRDKEIHYTGIAGENAVRLGACEEAVELLERTLELMGARDATRIESGARPMRFLREVMGVEHALEPTHPSVQRGRIEGLLSEARCQLGEHKTGLVYARRALASLGMPMPDSALEHGLGLMAQAALRGLQSSFPGRYQTQARDARAIRLQATAIQTRATESFFYTQEPLSLFWSAFRMLNLGEPAGVSGDLARGWILMGVVLGVMPLHSWAERCCQKAMELAREVGSPYELGFVGQRNAVYKIYVGKWSEVEAGLNEVLAIAEEVRNPRQILESRTIMAVAKQYQGQFADSLERHEDVSRRAAQTANEQVSLWGLIGRGYNLLRLRRTDDALKLIEHSRALINAETASADIIMHAGMEAMTLARVGRLDEALVAVAPALEEIERQAPVAYWTQQGVSGVTEACLMVMRDPNCSASLRARATQDARRASKGMSAFGKKFPFGLPFALLWEGALFIEEGVPRKAIPRLEEAIAEGSRLGMPYEMGRAHLELARVFGGRKADYHLRQAHSLLSPLGVLPPDSPVPSRAEDFDVA